MLAKDLSISFLASFFTDSAFREKRLMNDQTNKINGVDIAHNCSFYIHRLILPALTMIPRKLQETYHTKKSKSIGVNSYQHE